MGMTQYGGVRKGTATCMLRKLFVHQPSIFGVDGSFHLMAKVDHHYTLVR